MNIEKEIANLELQLSKDKEFFWNHAEPSNEEFETQEYICNRLLEMGYKKIETYKPTGIVATLEGPTAGEVIAFRCELDAVLVECDTDKCMHICGHDAHMSIMLSLAKILMDNRNKIKGAVKLIFQPNEEESCGAQFMISHGALENPKVDRIFAIHIWGELPEGTIGIKAGSVMTSKDPFSIVVNGKKQNVDVPEDCIDTIYVANCIGKDIKELSRNSHLIRDKAKVGLVTIAGGAIEDEIINKVHLIGNCITYDNEVRSTILKSLNEIVKKANKYNEVDAELSFYANCPVTSNSKEEAQVVQELAQNIAENVDTKYRAMNSAEDFSLYLEKVSGAFIFVGCYKDEPFEQHYINFKVDMKPMLIGTQLFYDLTKKYVM